MKRASFAKKLISLSSLVVALSCFAMAVSLDVFFEEMPAEAENTSVFDQSIVTLRPHGYYCEANVNNDGFLQGNAIQLYGMGTTSKQKIEQVDGEWYRISAMKNYEEQSYASHCVWDVTDRSKASGASVHVWGSHSDSDIPTSRQWSFSQNADGTYYIVNRNSGLYLALGGSQADENGTPLIQSDTPVSWDIDVVLPHDYKAQEASTHAYSASWMQKLDDTTKLSDVTLPGAHDAGTCYTFGAISPQISFTACQQLYIDELLQAGVRFLDMRLGPYVSGSHDPNINHGGIACEDHDGSTLSLSKTIKYCQTFLAEHPTESVVMMVSHSQGNVSQQTSALYSAMQENPDLFYSEETVPTVGEARGKIVLLRRFVPEGPEASSHTYGIDLSSWGEYNPQYVSTKGLVKITDNDDHEAWVQDNYSTTATDKIAYVNASFDQAEKVQQQAHNTQKNAFVFNYTSCTKSNPFSAARNMNKRLFESPKLVRTQPVFLGVVVMDFVNARQAEQIWSCNF